jgi:hypothetical protein
MKYILAIFSIPVLTACSKPIEGLWIEAHETALLKFDGDSVMTYYWNFRLADTLNYQIRGDSITFSGANPELTGGLLQYTLKYQVSGDSLCIWSNGYKTSYFKSNADNLKEHFLSRGGLDIKLPTAQNVKVTPPGNDVLNIRIGFLGEAVKIFVDNKETNVNELSVSIKKFKQSVEELDRGYIISQLFIDERVPCEYMFLMIEHLRANNISGISFIAINDEYDPYTEYFLGLRLYFPREKVNYVVKE